MRNTPEASLGGRRKGLPGVRTRTQTPPATSRKRSREVEHFPSGTSHQFPCVPDRPVKASLPGSPRLTTVERTVNGTRHTLTLCCGMLIAASAARSVPRQRLLAGGSTFRATVIDEPATRPQMASIPRERAHRSREKRRRSRCGEPITGHRAHMKRCTRSRPRARTRLDPDAMPKYTSSRGVCGMSDAR
jgi:hypothetical protein